MDELKPCPFCGGSAEADSAQGFRAIVSGRMEEAAAIYCTRCVVQMTHCYSDHRGTSREELMSDLVERWNTRAASGGLNEPFGNPEQFDVNEHSGNSRQLASLEQRAEDLLRVARNGWFETSDPVPHGAAIRAITAALANQQGVGKDAARYRWLRGNCFINQNDDRDFPHAVIMVQWFDGKYVCRMHPGHHPGVGIPGLDSAIDAAMATQPAGDVGRPDA